jgi:hypothetical protein
VLPLWSLWSDEFAVNNGEDFIKYLKGFTELFLDNGKDKNLTNCEIYGVVKKNQKVVCGELAALVGYIPGVEIKADAKARVVDLKVAK